MVTQFSEVRTYARYDLSRVHELAREQCVVYVNRDVQRDTDKYGYDFDEVCRCLAQLQPADFRHSGCYEDRMVWLDVYVMRYQAPSGHIDELYIKLSLNKNCLVVNIFSFHPSRA